MERIYHPWNKWEDYKHGFYNNCSGIEKQQYVNKVIEMFNDPKLTEEYMMKVINEWKYSCEHNLSNISMNRIAYLGQAACCLYAGIPNTITMETWSSLDKNVQNLANKIADKVLNIWSQKIKNHQLCLNID